MNTRRYFQIASLALMIGLCGLWDAASASAGSYVDYSRDNSRYENPNAPFPDEMDPETNRDATQEKISNIFSNLETVGGAYNSGGSKSAALAMVDAGCRATIDRAMNTKLFAELKNQLSPDVQPPAFLSQMVNGQISGAGQTTLGQLCAALKGEDIASPNLDQMLKKGLKNNVIHQAISYGQTSAQASGIPFLSRLEIETGTSERSWIGSITSIQPLWQDKFNLHHIFAQLSWYKAPEEALDDGQRTKFDTYNAGLAYRYLTPDKSYLYGANVFFDYTPHNDHTRMSVGVDARTSQLAVSANRYIPISTWRSIDAYNEERAAAGWDVQLRGQVPELPSWTGILKGYQWDGFQEGEKLYGAQAAVEYSPFPAMAVRVGVKDESEGTASLEAALRFNWRFDQPQDLQFKPRMELASVEDYVYEKVQRENIIRVKQRQKASAKLTVIETSGANTALEPTGASSLYVRQTLKMPVTVTVANTLSAVARLQFSDGSLLTLGQNSQVTINPALITLVYGSMQYVSNGIIHTIAVPGGTIALHGTDIDVVANGANSSSVRVRDGSVTFTGTASGAADLAPEELAASVNGVVGSSLPTNSATYISHTDLISTNIDRVASPQNGQKVTPYPYEPPRIVSGSVTPGHQIVLGLKFNDPVTVVSGTPQLHIRVNGVNKIATYLAGSGTTDLQFGYTLVPADAGGSNIIVTGFDKNGASIMGNGKDAVTTIADTTLPLSGTIGDVTAPSGYSTNFLTTPINNANKSAGSFRITSAEVATLYHYTISSSGGGVPVSGSGTVTSATQTISGLDLSGLNDGTLTVSVYLDDVSGNVGGTVTATAVKDTLAPTGYGSTFTTSPINSSNKSAIGFNITSAEIGTSYTYTLSSSGGGTAVTGSGTVTSATQAVSGVNGSALLDGTYSLSITLTDSSGNAGAASVTTLLGDSTPPTGYTSAFTTTPISNANKTAAAFQFAGAEIGASYTYTITSSGGGTAVTGSGTIGSATESVTGLDLSGLNDGTLSLAVQLTDASGNVGTTVTNTATSKDTGAPTSYTAAFTTSPISNANKTAGAIQISSAEVGAGYAYSITSSGGGTAVTGSGTVSAATQNVIGLDLSGLNDGTLTVSVVLTDVSGNAGAAATGTVAKDTTGPTGYATAFTTSPINNANKSAGAIQMTSAEVGAGYAYSITSSGGGTAVTGSGTVSAATQNVIGLDLSGLNDGTLTVSVVLTDVSGNAGAATTGTVTKDTGAPTGYAAAFTTPPDQQRQ